MVKLVVAILLLAAIVNIKGTEAKPTITSVNQLEALQQLSGSPYPWTDWVKLRANLAGVSLDPPAVGVDPDTADATLSINDDSEDEDDEEESEEDGPQVIEFLKRSVVAAESKKSKAKKGKATKLKPWEEALAAKKAAAAASTTTTPSPVPAVPQFSYEELAKAILAVQAQSVAATTTTTTPEPETPESASVDYKQLAQALLSANE